MAPSTPTRAVNQGTDESVREAPGLEDEWYNCPERTFSSPGTSPASNPFSESGRKHLATSRCALVQVILRTKKRLIMCGFMVILLCLVVGIIALTVPDNNGGNKIDPVLAKKDRFKTFRTTLDRFSPPWVFMLPSTPQTKALNWIVFKDKSLPTYPLDETRLVQRYALMTLFYACGGHSWKGVFSNHKKWELLIETHECDFPGVKCSTKGFVDNLEAPLSNIVGQLPDEIGLLTSLTLLDLHDNYLHGTLPKAVFRGLTNLGKCSQCIALNQIRKTKSLTRPWSRAPGFGN